MSPALAGGFSSTLPPGSPGLFFFFFFPNSLLTITVFLSPMLLSFLWLLEAIKGLLQI